MHVCVSLVVDWGMNKEELKKSLFDAIQRLENDGLVDYHFRECYLLKEDTDPTFFFELISNFSTEARNVVTKMGKTLNQSLVDFVEMMDCCMKLKGCAASIGACRISAVCSNLHQAVENNSKKECLQALNNIKHELKELRSRLNVVLEDEHKLISGVG
ncbi:histidine-containing phosphotransfer protein 1-like [Primulina tabacum]|uniref:histidine-containing phosphotransfer protein 1-like n=1 Tax=Primulina tabacum TaxID=48773 RepID=UPI003F59F38F